MSFPQIKFQPKSKQNKSRVSVKTALRVPLSEPGSPVDLTCFSDFAMFIADVPILVLGIHFQYRLILTTSRCGTQWS